MRQTQQVAYSILLFFLSLLRGPQIKVRWHKALLETCSPSARPAARCDDAPQLWQAPSTLLGALREQFNIYRRDLRFW